MKNHIKDYFTFTRSERNGAIILLCLIFFIPLIINISSPKNNQIVSNDSLLRIESEQFLNSTLLERQFPNFSESERLENYKKKRKAIFNPFPFDPNSATEEDYQKMGFTQKQSATIIKYRQKGGVFRKKQDFGKLYVVDAEVYEIFEPFILIKPDLTDDRVRPINNLTQAETSRFNEESSSKKIIEINAADSIELLKIRGVGPVFASRIIKYRNKLGGFVAKEQLREVYGIDSLRYPQISEQVRVDTNLIRKINLNEILLAELQIHPYMNYKTAKALIDKRVQSGGFKSINDVEKALLKKKELIEKIKPYVVFK